MPKWGLGRVNPRTISHNYIILANSSNQTIDVSSFQTGNYSVSLIINGVITDTKQLIIH